LFYPFGDSTSNKRERLKKENLSPSGVTYFPIEGGRNYPLGVGGYGLAGGEKSGVEGGFPKGKGELEGVWIIFSVVG